MENKIIPTPPKRPIPQKPNIQRSIPPKPDIKRKENNQQKEIVDNMAREEKDIIEIKTKDQAKTTSSKEEIKENSIESKAENGATKKKQLDVPQTSKTKKENRLKKEKHKNNEKMKEILFGVLGGVFLLLALTFFVLMFVI